MTTENSTKIALIDANALKADFSKRYGNEFSKYVIAAVQSVIDHQPRLTDDAAEIIMRTLFEPVKEEEV